MSFAGRCILASCLVSFFFDSTNWIGSINSTDILGTENHFGNGHFLGKCWHLLGCTWQRNVLWVFRVKSKKSENKKCRQKIQGKTIILQLSLHVDRWRNTCGSSPQGDFLLLKETKAIKHGNFGISLQLPARVGRGFAPIKLHYFGTAGTHGSSFLLSLAFSPTDWKMLPSPSCWLSDSSAGPFSGLTGQETLYLESNHLKRVPVFFKDIVLAEFLLVPYDLSYNCWCPKASLQQHLLHGNPSPHSQAVRHELCDSFIHLAFNDVLNSLCWADLNSCAV